MCSDVQGTSGSIRAIRQIFTPNFVLVTAIDSFAFSPQEAVVRSQRSLNRFKLCGLSSAAKKLSTQRLLTTVIIYWIQCVKA